MLLDPIRAFRPAGLPSGRLDQQPDSLKIWQNHVGCVKTMSQFNDGLIWAVMLSHWPCLLHPFYIILWRGCKRTHTTVQKE